MQRLRFSGELALPFVTIGFALAIYLILMLINLVGIRSQLEPLTDPQNLVARLDTESLVVISEEFSVARQDIDRLSDDLGPVEWFGRNLHGVPIIGSSSLAVTNLLRRTSEDLSAFDSTIQAVTAANDLLAGDSRTFGAGDPAARAELAGKLQELKSTWSETLSQLERASTQFPSSWPLDSQFNQVESAEKQLIAVSAWGVRLLDAASNTLALSGEVESVFDLPPSNESS